MSKSNQAVRKWLRMGKSLSIQSMIFVYEKSKAGLTYPEIANILNVSPTAIHYKKKTYIQLEEVGDKEFTKELMEYSEERFMQGFIEFQRNRERKWGSDNDADKEFFYNTIEELKSDKAELIKTLSDFCNEYENGNIILSDKYESFKQLIKKLN